VTTKLFLIPLILSAASFAQDVRGTFSGTVTDQQGAAVAKAKIIATETQTGTKTSAISGDSGAYTLPFLAPGKYDIAAEASGFKKSVRQGLTLNAGAHPVIDIHLEIGSINQAVTVTAESPLITASNASIGQVITTREVEDLPVNGRTPLMLANLAMGVVSTFEPGPVRPFDNGAPTSVSLGGAPSGTNETLLDGAPDAGFGNALAYSPPQDAVSEVRVNAFESNAAYGHTGGGTLNQVTKSGTNSFHGSLYEFNQTSFLDANSFFTNKAGQPRPPYHYNQYGVSAGGPVWIPKLYNGKNRVFWFFAYEGLKDSDPANSPLETGNPVNFATVPTQAERNGDFSALLKLNTPKSNYTIFNPYTGTQSGSTITRQPFPNNVIPPNLLNPVSQAILKYYPLPNAPGKSDGSQNYIVNAIDTDTYDNELGRLDLNITDKDKLFFDARHNDRIQLKNPYFPNISQGNYLYRINQGAVADNVYSLSPTLVLDVRANWTRYIEVHANPSDGFDVTTLGFPAYVRDSSQTPQFPVINMSSCSVSAGSEASFQCLGYNGDGSNTYDAYQLYGNLTKIRGNHTFQFGPDIRDYRWSAATKGNSSGGFTFNTNWTNGPASNAAASPFGQDFAALLLGLPTSGSYDNNAQSTVRQQYYSAYIQDDWRAKSNLTLNLGLRFEHETPITERYNRAVNGFNPGAVNPISSAAQAAYAAAYAAGAYTKTSLVPPTPNQFSALGALNFATANDPFVYHTESSTLSPRFGFAWSPALLGSGTVVRGGFGIFVSPIEVLDNGSSSTVPTLPQQGYSQTTQFTATNNNFLSPANMLSNPFPSGILPQNYSLGPGTFLGQSISFFNPHVRNPYDIRWNLSIQRQLPGQMVLEVAYIGNHAVHLPITTQFDSIPRQYLSASSTRDDAAVANLTGTVTNPFKGLLPNSSNLNGSSVALQQLLIPFPQYPVGSGTTNGLQMAGNGAGSSYYQSLDVRLQKRYTNGLTLINNFIYESLINRLQYLNDSDSAPVKSVSNDSRPLREVLAAVYDLPIGRGKSLDFHSGWANALLGGWELSGDITFQSGPPLSWGDVVYYGGPLNYNAHHLNGNAFDINQFAIGSSLQPVQNSIPTNVRTFNLMFNNLRRDPTKNLDLSAIKKFIFRERTYFELRFETYNTTNHVTLGGPQLSPTNASFGLISTQANTPRRVQLGARLVW
jgi:hypothetical protein